MTWHGLEIPADFCTEGRKAPLQAPMETSATYRRVLVKILEGTRIPANAFEAGLSTAAALLEGAQGFISVANELTHESLSPEKMRTLTDDLLRTVGALLGQRRTAYAVHQLASFLASSLPSSTPPTTLPRLPRLKDFMTPLESALECVGVGKHMDTQKLGMLCVHLDEFYDDCALLFVRLSHLLSLELAQAQAVAPDFLRRVYTDFAKASFSDHLQDEQNKPREEEEPDGDPFASQGRDREPMGSGLLSLLPELSHALASM